MRSPDLSVRRRQRGIPEDAILANLLALGSLLATVVAFMTAFSVLGSYDYANKFENGALPPGTDGARRVVYCRAGLLTTIVMLCAEAGANTSAATVRRRAADRYSPAKLVHPVIPRAC